MEFLISISPIAALIISLIALFLAGRANNLNIKIFKRQGVIDLHMAWHGVNDIDQNNLVGPDVINAVNALSLTASLWNHDVIDKEILYQSYWGSYKEIYDKLYNLDILVPGLKKTCKVLMTTEIRKAYRGMEDYDLKTVKQSKI